MPIEPEKSSISTLFLIISIIILFSLFIFPSIYIDIVFSDIEKDLNKINDEVIENKLESAQRRLNDIDKKISESEIILYTFLNHENINRIKTSIKGCIEMIKVDERGQMLLELQSVLSEIESIKTMEKLNLKTLF